MLAVFTINFPSIPIPIINLPPPPPPCDAQGLTSKGHSSVDNFSGMFLHDAVDLGVSESSGCVPCGVSAAGTALSQSLAGLRLTRLHTRFDRSGFFGPGVTLDLDQRLLVRGNTLCLIDPSQGNDIILANYDAPAWTVPDVRSLSLGLWNDAEQVVPTAQVQRIAVRGADQRTTVFEMSAGLTDGSRGRVLRVQEAGGASTALAWVNTRAVAGTDVAKWYVPSQITAPTGEIGTFTCSPTLVGDCYPITVIAVPGGRTLTYTYGELYTDGARMVGLKSVARPDGTTSVFSFRRDSPGDAYTIDDPAAAVGHQRKVVVFNPIDQADPWWGAWLGVNRWRVAEVRKGTNEYSYRSRRMTTATELWHIFQAGGVTTRLVYDRSTRKVLRTDRATNATAPNLGTDPTTWTWTTIASYTMDANRVTATTDVLGRSTSRQYQASTGLPAGSTGPDNIAQPIVRNAQGFVMSETDRLGRTTTYTRDTAGNMLTRTRASGTPSAVTETWTYNAVGQVLTAKDALLRVTDYAYDPNGRLLTRTDPADVTGGTRPVTTLTYDALGRVNTVKDPLNRTVTFGYDNVNRQTSATYGDGTTETTTYGTGTTAGCVVSRKDRTGAITTYGYDAVGRRNLASQVITRADGSTETVTESWTFVSGTELEASHTRNGETTVYAYDSQGRRTSATMYATGTKTLTATYTYDTADRRTWESDPYGRKTYFVYDVLDRVVRTVREAVAGAVPAGTDLTALARLSTADVAYVIEDMAYDAEGRITSRTDVRGTVVTSAYDTLGRLASQTQGFGTPVAATTVFTYDKVGNQTRIDHPRTVSESAVFATVKTYTNRNLLKTVVEGFGRTEAGTTTYTYGLDGRVATVSDANSKVTTNTYSSCCGRLSQVKDPLGFFTKYTYDGNGNVLTTVDGNNLTTTMTYDVRNRPLKRTDALGKVWTYTYDDNLLDGAGLDAVAKYATQLAGLGFSRTATTGADGSAVAVLDPNGNETVTVYDGVGRTVRTIDGLRKITTTAYDQSVTDAATGAVLVSTVRTDALNATVAQWADGLGRVRVQVDALGKQVRSTYDAGGNRLSVLDADNVGETCTYDALGRKSACSNAGSGAVTHLYDAAGNLVRTTDAQGAVELYAYDPRNRKVYHEDRVGAQTRFTFDKVGNLLTITDGQNGVTTYTYDARNLLLTEAFPGTTGGTRTYTYDGGRRLKTRTDQTTLITTYVYDNANRLTARQYPDALNDAFVYDAGGRLLTATSGRYGTTVTRTYDNANRVLTENLALGGESWTTTGAYSDTGLLTKLTLPDSTVQDRGYTTRGELNSTKLDGSTVATRTYTNGGRLATTVSANGKTETRTYTAAGDGLVEKITTPLVTDFTYTYDSLKRKKAEIDLITPSNTQNFSYDAGSRLTAWNRVTGTAGPVETQQTWSLSSVGDWNSTTKDGVVENRTHTPVHEVSTVNGVALTYDAKGNLTTDQQAQTFTWDVENRLASAAGLVQQAGQTSATYAYDALGRRVRKTVGLNQTTWVSWGAQEVYQLERNPTAIAADQPPTTPTDGGASPVTGGSIFPSGSLLADATATRVTFQPAAAITPANWLADTGAVYGVRSGATSFGWVGTALNQTVNREWTGWSLYDTYNQPWTTWATAGSTRATWELGVANGTYPVVLVCGDARSIQQRNDFLVEGMTFNDPSPWDGVAANPTSGQLGKFVYLSGTVTVADGKLTIQPNTTAKAPKICFIEVGAVGTTLDANFVARATAALSTVNARTANGRPDAVKPIITASVFGTYVDDLLGYRVQKSVGAYATKTQYWTHSNHLYSVAAVTDATGAVVERYSYTAYGQQSVKDGVGTVIGGTAVGQTRGFTGYRGDGETGAYYARVRMYAPKMGTFISRDSCSIRIGAQINFVLGTLNLKPVARAMTGYQDGMNLYSGYFVYLGMVDPSGMNTCEAVCKAACAASAATAQAVAAATIMAAAIAASEAAAAAAAVGGVTYVVITVAGIGLVSLDLGASVDPVADFVADLRARFNAKIGLAWARCDLGCERDCRWCKF